ncbi:hypothetical protein WMY93_028876 [Mugilogobius chulae]|uniref:Uncharacterized protein n=1 Tax=Mugilogobius chulae TaxID=88201 RepID=A0AAW0MUA3_9GOBI
MRVSSQRLTLVLARSLQTNVSPRQLAAINTSDESTCDEGWHLDSVGPGRGVRRGEGGLGRREGPEVRWNEEESGVRRTRGRGGTPETSFEGRHLGLVSPGEKGEAKPGSGGGETPA